MKHAWRRRAGALTLGLAVAFSTVVAVPGERAEATTIGGCCYWNDNGKIYGGTSDDGTVLRATGEGNTFAVTYGSGSFDAYTFDASAKTATFQNFKLNDAAISFATDSTGYTFVFTGTNSWVQLMNGGQSPATITTKQGATLTIDPTTVLSGGFSSAFSGNGQIKIGADTLLTCTTDTGKTLTYSEGDLLTFTATDGELNHVTKAVFQFQCKHTYGDWQHDATNHWKVCTKCGEIGEKAAHSGGDWEHDANGHWKSCSTCGAHYDAHDHNFVTTTLPATYTTPGIWTNTCADCGYATSLLLPQLATVGTETAVTTASGEAGYSVQVSANGTVEASYTGTGAASKKTVKVPDTITLSDGTVAKVTEIEDGAFQNDKKVQSVTVGKNVTTIGKNAFSGASKLKKVTLGKNVTTIEKNAFKGDKSLKTIKITSKSLKKVGKKAFSGISKKATVTVPAKKVTAYKKVLKKAGLPSTAKVKK